MSNRSFNDFAATLSFYTPPGGNVAPVEEEKSGLMGWASRGYQTVTRTADEVLMTRQKLGQFALFLAAGIFCMMLSLTFLPFLLIAPQKFAALFTVGSLLILSSFSVLKGHQAFQAHLITRERLPFTIGYLGSLLGTLYSALWAKTYLLTIFFSLAQIIGLLYFLLSYFPGGASALTYMGGVCMSGVKACIFGGSSSPGVVGLPV